MAEVSLHHLSKRYASGTAPAVHDVDVTIGHGELFVLLGPSGCGKSTTLRMIAGLESISAGELRIDGELVNGVPAKDRDIAMVFQSYALYPHMNVRENLAFGLRRRGFKADEMERRVAQAAQTLGLDPYLARKPHALSGGQRQRVALGRAIVRDPKVFLFDEPLSNLDAALRVSTRSELTQLHQRLGATMIYVTHDQVEAMTMGTRICIMNGGRVEQVGAPLEVYRRPANVFVAAFLGSPPMNLLPVALVADGGEPWLTLGDQSIDARPLLGRLSKGPETAAAVLGIRPEDVTIATGAGMVAEVVNCEALGAETLALLRLPGVEAPLRARLDRDFRSCPGERIAIALDLGRASLFETGSGRALPLTDD